LRGAIIIVAISISNTTIDTFHLLTLRNLSRADIPVIILYYYFGELFPAAILIKFVYGVKPLRHQISSIDRWFEKVARIITGYSREENAVLNIRN